MTSIDKLRSSAATRHLAAFGAGWLVGLLFLSGSYELPAKDRVGQLLVAIFAAYIFSRAGERLLLGSSRPALGLFASLATLFVIALMFLVLNVTNWTVLGLYLMLMVTAAILSILRLPAIRAARDEEMT